MRNYKLDASLLPEVWLTWRNKDGAVYMNGKNGKRQQKPEKWMGAYMGHTEQPKIYCGCDWTTEKLPRIWVNSGTQLAYAYAKYHADIERIEFAVVMYDTSRGEYAHEWKFAGERFFVGKDKSCLLSDGSVYIDGYKKVFTYHHEWNLQYVLRLIVRQHFNENFINEFKKFIGEEHFLIGDGSTVQIDRIWHITKWYESVQKARGKGKQQKLTDELTSIQLRDLYLSNDKYPIKESLESRWCNMKNVAYCEKVNDNWSVLRMFERSKNSPLKESWRVYIGKDGTTRVVSKNANNDWIPSRHMAYKWDRGYFYMANKDEALVICPRIKYILSAAKFKDDHREVDALITALRFPEIEQMCKLGYINSAKNIAQSNTPKADLKDLFGGYYNDKEKNLLRKVGMTKPQLDAYMNENGEKEGRTYIYDEWKNALATMRQMFGSDLSSLDIDSFSKYLRACKEYRRFKHYNGEYLMDYLSLNLDNGRFFKNLVRLMSKRSDIFGVVYDTMNSYRNLRADRRFDIDWYFDDVSDAVRIHDAVVELYNLQCQEDRARYNLEEAQRKKKEEEKRKKLDEKRKIYEYEDDDFIIKLPKTANEIVYEGTSQGICIGSYVSRHSLGDTNLFFLRRKSEPDTPFYAIEMNNSYNIVQIHGKYNKWLGNNPEAIPTVIRWLRKHGIKCNNEILTCTSTGYGKVNNYVPMPVVD